MTTETVSLKAEVRKESGSNAALRLRKEGKLPIVVYGHKQEPVSIAVNAHDFIEELHHGHRVFNVEVEGKTETLLVKDIQYDYLGKNVLHADMLRVNLSERMKVEVPLDFVGVARGTLLNGVVDEVMTFIEVECSVMEIPPSIKVGIRDLGINDSLHAKDITLPSGCTLVTDPNALVIICHERKAVVEAPVAAPVEGEEVPTEPEVITERKKEEEEKESE